MKFLKILLGIILAIVAIYFIGGLFLPKSYSVTRNTVINAPDSVVYNNIANFNNFMKWNPWYKMDPTTKVVITGETGQPGHKYTWDGEKLGKGEMLIEKVDPPRLVDEELKFIDNGGVADNIFTLEQVPEGTKVVWTLTGNSQSINDKWMGVIMPIMFGKSFEDGLKDLKEVSEKK